MSKCHNITFQSCSFDILTQHLWTCIVCWADHISSLFVEMPPSQLITLHVCVILTVFFLLILANYTPNQVKVKDPREICHITTSPMKLTLRPANIACLNEGNLWPLLVLVGLILLIRQIFMVHIIIMVATVTSFLVYQFIGYLLISCSMDR